jgi:arabinan endo-1,5-alpha-L-arabinosidase
MKIVWLLILLNGFLYLRAQGPGDTLGKVSPTRETSVHDPVAIQQGNKYYLFCTGWGISAFSSPDLRSWRREAPVFPRPPAWTQEAVKGFKGHFWAPDISYHNGQYYLYYAISAFGKNTSCIGLAINRTLDPASPDFKWVDAGMVVQSVPGRDMWNAIDPNEIDDEQGNHWLDFGSFWEGIKLVRLDTGLRAPAEPQQWYTIARRPRDPNLADSLAGNGAIEAPFIFHHGAYYYLFVSWDYCCRAEKSDYKVVVGRSPRITGPYLDKSGKPMDQNGGTLLVEGDGKEWFGAGHNAVSVFNGSPYLIYHGYDARDHGRPKLIIRPLGWDPDGWPVPEISK